MKDKRRKYDMRCLKCGYANQMSARFCVNCGSRLGIESAKKIQAENYNNIINNQNQQQQFPQQGQSGNPNGNMQMSNGQKQLYQQQPYQQQQINPNGNMQINNGQYPQQGQQINPNGNMYINNGQYPQQGQQINPNVNMYMNNGQQELPMK